jgi:hypothetical protein
MENCIYCGTLTSLYVRATPVCLRCDGLPAAARSVASQALGSPPATSMPDKSQTIVGIPSNAIRMY